MNDVIVLVYDFDVIDRKVIVIIYWFSFIIIVDEFIMIVDEFIMIVDEFMKIIDEYVMILLLDSVKS